MGSAALFDCNGRAQAVPLSQRVHYFLKTANGTTYNAYVVRGSDGVAVIDTVKEEASPRYFLRAWSRSPLIRILPIWPE